MARAAALTTVGVLGLMAALTKLGVVWACGSAEHAWPLVFWGGADGEEGLRNVAWIVLELLERAGEGT